MRGVCSNEERMIEPAADERHVNVPAFLPQFGACGGNVLPILLTAGVRMLCGCDEADRVTATGRVHLPQRVSEERMPVAHPDVNREAMASSSETDSKAFSLPASDRGDRRHTTEQLVVMRHFLDTLRADTPATQDVRQERADVVRSLRTAE